jgi:FkbM family methyltransferase
MVVWDIGAHVGYYTLIAARYVGAQGQVVAVEPLPANLTLLRKHLALNKVGNVTVIEGALTDQDGVGYLKEGASNYECFLSNSGIPVECFRLDTLVFQKQLPPPTLMKIDAEGSEGAILRGGLSVLRAFRPVIFLAVHSEALLQECAQLLLGIGYHLSNFLGVFELIADP